MLTLQRLSKAFGDKVLFEQISLQINEGDRLALIGPNGAGKTTLFSILLGVMEPDEDRVGSTQPHHWLPASGNGQHPPNQRAGTRHGCASRDS